MKATTPDRKTTGRGRAADARSAPGGSKKRTVAAGSADAGADFPAGLTEEATALTKGRACNLVEGNLRDAVESLEQAKDCLTGWDWSYVSPEDIDGVLRVLKKIIVHVVRETA